MFGRKAPPDSERAAVSQSQASRHRVLVRPTREGHGVTTLELLFDLVFVFALTQVTAVMAHGLSWGTMLRGLVLLALLWWAWCSYAWLGNQARADEGILRAGFIAAMAAMFVVALAIPAAWHNSSGGLPAAMTLAVALGLVRLGHLAVYVVAAAGDRGLRRQLARTAVPVVTAAALLVAGATVGEPGQTVLWAAALVIDYTGVYLAGSDDWRLPAPEHFAERHGLIVLIALGESVVSIGVGVEGLPLTWPLVAAVLLGLACTVALWWSYFDVVAPVAARVLASRTGPQRTRLARDSYTYLHFPMVAGIICLAVGLKKVMLYVADTSQYTLSSPLDAGPLWALYGGTATYLLAHLAFRKRNIGSINRPRLLVCSLLVVAPLAVAKLPALVTLMVLTAFLVGLIAFEVTRYAGARDAIRHGEAPA